MSLCQNKRLGHWASARAGSFCPGTLPKSREQGEFWIFFNYKKSKSNSSFWSGMCRGMIIHRGGRGPDWAGFACFSQPALQWTGLKIKIRNLHNKWSTRWALGSADRDGFMRVRVFFYYFFYGPKTRKIIHNLVNPIQILKIPIESTSPANNNKKKEL
jgi:hypothetical protein